MSPRTVVLVFSLGLTACAQQDDASPFAEAGPAFHGAPGQAFQLDGSASTGESLRWAFVSTPPGSALSPEDLTGADTPWPVFVPDVAGLYVLELVACADGLCQSSTTTARVGSPEQLAELLFADATGPADPDPLGLEALNESWGLEDHDPLELKGKLPFGPWRKNSPPVAVATARQGLRADSDVVLQGGNSYDPDGDTLRYRWSFASLPAASNLDGGAIDDPTGSSARFSPDAPGIYQLRLVVRDNTGWDSAVVSVEVEGGGSR